MPAEPLTPEAVAAMLVVAEAATEGPWRARRDEDCDYGVAMCIYTPSADIARGVDPVDAEFIFLARSDLPVVCRDWLRLHERCKELEAEPACVGDCGVTRERQHLDRIAALEAERDRLEREVANAKHYVSGFDADVRTLREHLSFLASKGITVGVLKESGKGPRLVYTIEPGSELDDWRTMGNIAGLESENAALRLRVAELEAAGRQGEQG